MSSPSSDSGRSAAQRGSPAPAKAGQPAAGAGDRPPAKSPPSAPAPAPVEGRPAPSASTPTPPPRRRWWIPLLLLLVLAAAGGGYYWYWLEHRPQDDSQLILQGNIDVRQVDLAFKVDGRITSLAVEEGDVVHTGQVVAQLDKRYFEDELKLARARRDNAAATLARLEHGSRPEEIAESRAQEAQQQATLTRARQDFERAERLVGKGAVSREAFDQARSALAEAEARVKYAQEGVRLAELGPRQEDIDAARAQLLGEDVAVVQAERRLADSELVVPSDGVILTRVREKGAIVAAGETVYTLTLASPVWVRTYVNEQDLGRIRPGLEAVVHTDSAPDKDYRGQIGFISPKAEFTPKTVETRELRTDLVYRLRVIVANPDGGLRQGMPVTVTLNVGTPEPPADAPPAQAAPGAVPSGANSSSAPSAAPPAAEVPAGDAPVDKPASERHGDGASPGN